MPERLDPNLFQFHLHLETCAECREPAKNLCGFGRHLLFHVFQSGVMDGRPQTSPEFRNVLERQERNAKARRYRERPMVSFDTAAPLSA
ncbi:MAG: hypothetical protein PHQ12_11000 [Chthoniobacteraceae bacterium]|nr:hypothetical protein [Chthoniobacteraceae bacterium]